jgi:peptidoglycan hydrolase CwlO-like protein
MNTTISKMQEELDDYSEDTTTLSDSLEKLQDEITSTTKNLDEIKNWYEYS